MSEDWQQFLSKPAGPIDGPVHRAAASDPLELARLLDGDSSRLEAKGQFGRRPLHHAARAGNAESVDLLLRRDASPWVEHLMPHMAASLKFGALTGRLADQLMRFQTSRQPGQEQPPRLTAGESEESEF